MEYLSLSTVYFFFNDTATTEIYTLSLHDALPIYALVIDVKLAGHVFRVFIRNVGHRILFRFMQTENSIRARDRKSTRLNSSHQIISYAVFCLKKKKNNHPVRTIPYDL